MSQILKYCKSLPHRLAFHLFSYIKLIKHKLDLPDSFFLDVFIDYYKIKNQ